MPDSEHIPCNPLRTTRQPLILPRLLSLLAVVLCLFLWSWSHVLFEGVNYSWIDDRQTSLQYRRAVNLASNGGKLQLRLDSYINLRAALGPAVRRTDP